MTASVSFCAVGECMAELSPAVGAGDFRLGFAGDTFNTAWYLASTAPNVTVNYVSALGDDPLSSDMLAFMAAARIRTDHVRQIPGKSAGLYMISLKDGERSFSYWRGQSAARHLAESDLSDALSDAALVYVSGITLAILLGDGQARLLSALARARENGAKVAFDPNLRPSLWNDPDTMRDAITRAATHADIVLPSFEDEATWFGDTDPEDTLARYAAPTVIVKNGPDPIVWRDGGLNGCFEPPQAPSIVDTTAAGDSFNAGFFAGLLTAEGTEAAIARGAALAARVIGGLGALVDVDD
ncbi:MAG: sugar kinase [Pseudomonadota bacterium]